MDARTTSNRSRSLACAALVAAAWLLLASLAPAASAATRATPRSTSVPAHAAAIDATELAEVRMINRFRASKGLRPLRVDGTLTRAAGWHAINLGTTGSFSHTDSLGRDPFQRMRAFGYPSGDTWRGENIAAGHDAPAPTYQQWLTSPPHRANWENSRFRAIGIARVHVPGSPYGWYWVTTFGSRWTTAPA